MGVADQPSGLEGTHRDRDTGPPHPKHHREKFVAERHLIALRAITGCQQPASKALRQRVSPVACRAIVRPEWGVPEHTEAAFPLERNSGALPRGMRLLASATH